MYHQNTLKIFSPQYVDMLAVSMPIVCNDSIHLASSQVFLSLCNWPLWVNSVSLHWQEGHLSVDLHSWPLPEGYLDLLFISHTPALDGDLLPVSFVLSSTSCVDSCTAFLFTTCKQICVCP